MLNSIEKVLLEHKLTLAVAESTTGGKLAAKITSRSGCSRYFLGGIIAYHNQVKMRHLGVAETLINEYGAVSSPVAEQMARGVRELFNADVAVSTTGVAGPGGGSEEKPVGLVYVAVASARRVIAHRYVIGNQRESNNEQFTVKAFALLEAELLSLTSS
tara:strand:+ start:315 stop:791 length:477 start_codon:yes stop_codon:yes gene_type:complete